MMLARSATIAAQSAIPRYLSTTTPVTSSGILGTSAISKILGSAGHVSGAEGSHVRGIPVRYKSTAALTDVADKVTNMQPVNFSISSMPSKAVELGLLTSLVWHMHSGINEILADYVHHEITRNFTKINLTAFSIIFLKDLVI